MIGGELDGVPDVVLEADGVAVAAHIPDDARWAAWLVAESTGVRFFALFATGVC